MKDFQRPAIPVFDDIVMSGESRVDKLAQIFSNRFSAMPIGNAEITNGVLGKAVEAFAEGFAVFFSGVETPMLISMNFNPLRSFSSTNTSSAFIVTRETRLSGRKRNLNSPNRSPRLWSRQAA